MSRQAEAMLTKIIADVAAERIAALSPEDEARGLEAFGYVRDVGARRAKVEAPEKWAALLAYNRVLAQQLLRADGLDDEANELGAELFDEIMQRARGEAYLAEFLTDDTVGNFRRLLVRT
jgi:hypothetical protein